MPADPSSQLHLIALGSPFVEVWFNGFYLCLAAFTIWSITQKPQKTPRDHVSIAIVIMLYISSTVHATTDWWIEVNAFTNFGATPAIVDALARQPAWYKALGSTLFALNMLIADTLFIWRCWVVWSKSWRVVIVPIIATVTGTVLSIISIIGQVLVASSRTPGVIPTHFVQFTIPYLALSCATSLLTTCLIAAKIIKVQHDFSRAGTESIHRKSYTRAVEIIVESAVIYSINLLVVVILIGMKNFNLSYPLNIHAQISGIAPTLIIFRVALGHSRDDSAWTTREYSTGNLSFVLAKERSSPSDSPTSVTPTTLSRKISLVSMSEASPSRALPSTFNELHFERLHADREGLSQNPSAVLRDLTSGCWEAV